MLEVLPGRVATPAQQRKNRFPPVLRRIAERLLTWRPEPTFGWIEAMVMGAYCFLLGVAIHVHEPWSDEVQAWFLAGQNSISQLIIHRLHYEGTPVLWHLLLHILHSTGVGFASMPWYAGLFSVAGIFVLLRWSPFPLLVRILLPFTFFLQYQYAVVARSYNLFPLLLFGLCVLYKRRQNPVWFAIMAGLLANLCMQGLVVASCLSLLFAIRLYRDHRNGFTIPRAKTITATAVFGICVLVACYTALPAPDVNFAVKDSVSDGSIHKILVQLIGEEPRMYPAHPLPGPKLPPEPDVPTSDFLTSPRAWAAWQFNHQAPSAARTLEEFAISMSAQATWGISRSNLFACAFLCVAILWLRRRHSFHVILPWAALLLIGEVIWVADHHVGMILLTLMASFWLAADRHPYANPWNKLELGFTSLLTCVMLIQVFWMVSTLRKDIYSNYDPGKETAEYMKAHPVNRTASFNYWAESIQAYFPHNPFFNIPTQYRLWSSHTNPDPYYQEALASHPDRVVYSAEFPGPGIMRNQWLPFWHIPDSTEIRTLPWDQAVNYFQTHGYVETHRFCGERFSRSSYSFLDCDLIFEPADRNSLSLAEAQHPHNE